MRVLLIRPNRNEADAEALSRWGIDTDNDPYLEISSAHNDNGAKKMLAALARPEPKWLIITSTNSLRYWQESLPPGMVEKVIKQSSSIRFAAIGEQTKQQLHDLGAHDVMIADRFDAHSLAASLSHSEPLPVVIPSGSIAMKTLDNSLRVLGFTVISEVVYQTRPTPETPSSVSAIAAGDYDAVLLRSPSAARAFLAHNPRPKLALMCGGQSTARAVIDAGAHPDLVVSNPAPEPLAEEIFNYFSKGNHHD